MLFFWMKECVTFFPHSGNDVKSARNELALHAYSLCCASKLTGCASRHERHPDLPSDLGRWATRRNPGSQTKVPALSLWSMTGKRWNISVIVAWFPLSAAAGTCVWMETTWALLSPWTSSCASDTSAPLSCRGVRKSCQASSTCTQKEK